MKNYIVHDEWKIIEDGFHPDFNRISESLFSLGNGLMGGRGNFEEHYSGDSLQGNYLAGIYYPDKTRVGWWKNGYPEYFAKILNAANWWGMDITINGNRLDLNTMFIESFQRELNMKEGTLRRDFIASFNDGKRVKVSAMRFLSIHNSELGAMRYSLTPLNFDADIEFKLFVDFDVENEDSNYDEKFWEEVKTHSGNKEGYVIAETRKTEFQVCSGMKYNVLINHEKTNVKSVSSILHKYVSSSFNQQLEENQTITIERFVTNVTSENEERNNLLDKAIGNLKDAKKTGFSQLYKDQKQAWEKKWQTSDVRIEGDVAAQQGIRFNIFQLNQTYTGEDERLNVGPKGFTGEKYGGTTYWDTEAYCFPFFLATADQKVARNLLLYRYKHLSKAIENAQNLGFDKGAALYPMVTINGEECHNEWEITFEEIHRNGAIAYAIYDYLRYTGDDSYLFAEGLEVLIGISRFWSQRVNWSEQKQKYVMLGVTGPNEYENNVNNNWHTNKLAQWTLTFTLEALQKLKENDLGRYKSMLDKTNFKEDREIAKWREIIENIYFPWDEKRQIYLQQDGFLDKELIPVSEINPDELPINQHWSWDRILRSPYIKQADVLQSMYWFENEYDTSFIERHFDFYEPLTVHESSLSSCIHSILAAVINRPQKAYEMYLRTARLDLDDYNNDTEDGLHITSMGGTWMAFVYGLVGMRVRENRLVLNPFIPQNWEHYSFKINFRGALLEINVSQDEVHVLNYNNVEVPIVILGKELELKSNEELKIAIK